MTDKIKRTIKQSEHYKLIRITYLDFGYMSRRRYRHYLIVDKDENINIGMFSDIKLAKKELKHLEIQKRLESII